mmetsp:Transcript_16846/g.38845  ORF Transcript_16846/g.38845 Transcript_16846/m.38845 type:complete len:189 (+) Transcript_16846:44-610(+)
MRLLRWLAYRFLQVLGWKLVGEIPQNVNKAVLVIAPHTSNWDGFYGLLFCFIKQLSVKFIIKKEALFFPIAPLLKRIGAISIDRKEKKKFAKNVQIVQHMAALLQQSTSLFLVIAPEGTRKKVRRWKQGFYHIAVQAKVPIVLGYIDYQQKHIGIGPVVYPTNNFAIDFSQIQTFYEGKSGKYPAQGV